jgi:hypothetical protein
MGCFSFLFLFLLGAHTKLKSQEKMSHKAYGTLSFFLEDQPFSDCRNFAKKINYIYFKWNDFGGFQLLEARIFFGILIYWSFSQCSHKYRKLIEDLYFISSLEPDLAKSSEGWLPFYLHLSMDGHHLGYIRKFL